MNHGFCWKSNLSRTKYSRMTLSWHLAFEKVCYRLIGFVWGPLGNRDRYHFLSGGPLFKHDCMAALKSTRTFSTGWNENNTFWIDCFWMNINLMSSLRLLFENNILVFMSIINIVQLFFETCIIGNIVQKGFWYTDQKCQYVLLWLFEQKRFFKMKSHC